MKKLITSFLFLLLLSTSVFADITTFQNFGSLKLTIPSPSINPADVKVTYMLATGVIPDDGTIVGNLYNANDNLVANKRVYAYSGGDKNIPFGDLTFGQQGYLSGEIPEDKWGITEIKLWLKDKQKKDKDGNVSVDDPYYYNDEDTKEDLLDKVKKEKMSLLNWFRKQWKKEKSSSFNPRPDCLKAIEDKLCVEDTYACRHKSRDAHDCLKIHGYKVRVVSGPAEGWEKEFHVWIELEEDGEIYWYDPTWYNYDPVKYGCSKAPWSDRKIVEHEIHGVIKPTGDTGTRPTGNGGGSSAGSVISEITPSGCTF